MKYTTVSLPEPLVRKIKERIRGTGFANVSSFVEFVMRELVSVEKKEEVYTKEDEERIKERLRGLGYM